MSSQLQSKVQLLAILIVAFTLLGIPLFYQVRADAQTSRDQAGNTLLSKLFNKAAQEFQPPDDLDVEDARAPNADPDKDGLTNRQEEAQGRNPTCNEEKEGAAKCEDKQDSAANQSWPELNDELYYEPTGGSSLSEEFSVAAPEGPYYDRWKVYWNVTNYQSTADFKVVVEHTDNATQFCCATTGTTILRREYAESTTLSPPPPPGSYRIRVVPEGTVLSGTWELTIRGLRDARAAT